MALRVERLSREKELDMTVIKVAKETYYIHQGKAYKRGENVPSGASLLVRKGSPVLPDVIDRYGVDVEDAESVTRVPDAGRTPARDVGVGVSTIAAEGLRRIEVTEQVARETAHITTAAQSAGAGTSRQGAMLREALVTERVKGEGGTDASKQVIEPGTAEAQATATQAGGIGGAPINEDITAKLEREEREAIGRHARSVFEGEKGSREDEPTGKSTSTADSTDTGAIKSSSLTPGGSSVTKEIAPEGESAAAKLRAEEQERARLEDEARVRAEDEARQREAQSHNPPPSGV